jgi:hypothetical protein
MHTPLGIDEASLTEDSEPKGSLTRQMKVREADMLLNVANEYMVTLKNVGRRINSLANNTTEDNLVFEKIMTKAVVDLYIGVGGEIRATIKTMADINQLLNGPDQSNTGGLRALAEAITGSKKGEE